MQSTDMTEETAKTVLSPSMELHTLLVWVHAVQNGYRLISRNFCAPDFTLWMTQCTVYA